MAYSSSNQGNIALLSIIAIEKIKNLIIAINIFLGYANRNINPDQCLQEKITRSMKNSTVIYAMKLELNVTKIKL